MASSDAATSRERILEEATRLFVANGYHGISMREIAAEVGLSKAGLYYHFTDKEHLLLAILMDGLDQIEDHLHRATAEGGTLREQLARLLHRIFAQAPAQRSMMRLASQEMSHLSQTAREDIQRVYREKFTGPIAALIAGGVERGACAD